MLSFSSRGQEKRFGQTPSNTRFVQTGWQLGVTYFTKGIINTEESTIQVTIFWLMNVDDSYSSYPQPFYKPCDALDVL